MAISPASASSSAANQPRRRRPGRKSNSRSPGARGGHRKVLSARSRSAVRSAGARGGRRRRGGRDRGRSVRHRTLFADLLLEAVGELLAATGQELQVVEQPLRAGELARQALTRGLGRLPQAVESAGRAFGRRIERIDQTRDLVVVRAQLAQAPQQAQPEAEQRPAAGSRARRRRPARASAGLPVALELVLDPDRDVVVDPADPTAQQGNVATAQQHRTRRASRSAAAPCRPAGA